MNIAKRYSFNVIHAMAASPGAAIFDVDDDGHEAPVDAEEMVRERSYRVTLGADVACYVARRKAEKVEKRGKNDDSTAGVIKALGAVATSALEQTVRATEAHAVLMGKVDALVGAQIEMAGTLATIIKAHASDEHWVVAGLNAVLGMFGPELKMFAEAKALAALHAVTDPGAKNDAPTTESAPKPPVDTTIEET